MADMTDYSAPSFNDHIDNNISAPGDNVSYDGIGEDNVVSLEEEQVVPIPSLIQDDLSNVLDVTGLRQTSEQSRLLDQTDDLNLISSDNEGVEESDITAVRRAAEDSNDSIEDSDHGNEGDANQISNADTDQLIVQRSQIVKNVNSNFVADQRIEVGTETLKNNNGVIIGRLPRNQRNFEEAAYNSDNTDGVEEARKEEDPAEINNNDNEITIDVEENFNSTNNETGEEEENRSGSVLGKKSVKLSGTSNELKSMRLKKPFQDSPNLIEDSVKSHKSVADLVKNLRRKRNVPSNTDIDSRKLSNICYQPVAQIKVKTSSGIVNMTQDYCQDCDSTPGNCSYSIPLSRYLRDIYIGVIFSAPVIQCSSFTPPTVCPSVNDINTTFQETSSVTDSESHQVNIEAHKVSYYKFRISLDNSTEQPSANICQETRLEKFIEFNLKFYRDCRG